LLSFEVLFVGNRDKRFILSYNFLFLSFLYMLFCCVASRSCQQSAAMQLEAAAWAVTETWHVTKTGRDIWVFAASTWCTYFPLDIIEVSHL
jgi:hypothetical protein